LFVPPGNPGRGILIKTITNLGGVVSILSGLNEENMKTQRSKFLLSRTQTYLNCAYMSPLMKQVEKAGIQGMRNKRNPALISAADFFTMTEVLRKEFATLVNAPDPRRIVVIPSASYGLSVAARNIPLKRGDNMVVASEQFPSNVYPWRRLSQETQATLHVVKPPDTLHDRGKEWNERLLAAITSATKVVSLGHVHWADGTRFNLEAIGKRVREVGAKLIIDGTQSVGALPFDIARIQPDALVCAGYKWLMGPYSIGLAYFGECFDQGIPLEENWINRMGSEDFAGLVNYQDRYQPGALRYEVGEHSNFILVPMMLEALRQVNAWGPENIQSYCQSITTRGIAQLRKHGYWIEEDDFRGQHLFGIRFPQHADKAGIIARVKKKKISVSFRGEFMRVSPHVYNDRRDFDRLVETLISVKL
jgi:selenocysteine lyase/cysteine desulfurase